MGLQILSYLRTARELNYGNGLIRLSSGTFDAPLPTPALYHIVQGFIPLGPDGRPRSWNCKGPGTPCDTCRVQPCVPDIPFAPPPGDPITLAIRRDADPQVLYGEVTQQQVDALRLALDAPLDEPVVFHLFKVTQYPPSSLPDVDATLAIPVRRSELPPFPDDPIEL